MLQLVEQGHVVLPLQQLRMLVTFISLSAPPVAK
jgi:hypothetical protein